MFSAKRPFRCHACGWRGWRDNLGPRMNSGDVPDPAPPLMPTELDLNDLDRLNSTGGRSQPEDAK